MIRFVLRRLLFAIPTLIAISVITFAVIELPPGDYLDEKLLDTQTTSHAEADALRHRYALDRSVTYRYFLWITRAAHGDFGESFRYERPVTELIAERLGWTLAVSGGSIAFIYAVGVPLGILAARRKGRRIDRLLAAAAFLGLSIPGFLVALVLLLLTFRWSGVPLFGLFSPDYEGAPWSGGKVLDLVEHLCIPVVVVALGGAGSLLRIVRANMLQTLGEPFVRTARAKGLRERTVVFKHAARIALNPVITMLGMSLPDVISGTTIVSIVLGLPTLGPLLLAALLDKDMFLAGTILMLMAVLLVAGNLIADICLALADPRIRHA